MRPRGWRYESARHALAAKGIRTRSYFAMSDDEINRMTLKNRSSKDLIYDLQELDKEELENAEKYVRDLRAKGLSDERISKELEIAEGMMRKNNVSDEQIERAKYLVRDILNKKGGYFANKYSAVLRPYTPEKPRYASEERRLERLKFMGKHGLSDSDFQRLKGRWERTSLVEKARPFSDISGGAFHYMDDDKKFFKWAEMKMEENPLWKEKDPRGTRFPEGIDEPQSNEGYIELKVPEPVREKVEHTRIGEGYLEDRDLFPKKGQDDFFAKKRYNEEKTWVLLAEREKDVLPSHEEIEQFIRRKKEKEREKK